MGVPERVLLLDDLTAGRFGTAGLEKIAPQPMKEVKLTSADAWQYFYLDAVLSGTVTDAELRGGPLAMLKVETNTVILDFGLLPEGSASLSDREYAAGEIAASLPIHVSRVAYKSAVAGSHGVIRFYACYAPATLESM